jgi:hypothetical protein
MSSIRKGPRKEIYLAKSQQSPGLSTIVSFQKGMKFRNIIINVGFGIYEKTY